MSNISRSNYYNLPEGRRRLKASPLPPKNIPQKNSSPQNEELKKICAEFASILAYSLINSFRSTIPKNTFFKQIEGKKLIESMIDQKMASYISSRNGFGIKEMLYKNLTIDKK